MTDQVICNCYDAAALENWADGEDIHLTSLRASDTGRIFVRGIVFCPEPQYDRLCFRASYRFRIRPMKTASGERAVCSQDELDSLLGNVDAMTRIPEPEEMVLPNVGDKVLIDLPPILVEQQATVSRVSPKTGNVRVSCHGKFWSVSWRSIKIL